MHLCLYESEKGFEGNPEETPPLFGKPKPSHDTAEWCLPQPALQFTHSQHFRQINGLHQILLALMRSVTNPTMSLYIITNKAVMKTCNCHGSFTTFSPKTFLLVVFSSLVQSRFAYG